MDGGGCKRIDVRVAFPKVMIDGFWVPSKAVGNGVVVPAGSAESHGGGDSVGMSDYTLDVLSKEVVAVWVCRNDHFSHSLYDVVGLEESVGTG